MGFKLPGSLATSLYNRRKLIAAVVLLLLAAGSCEGETFEKRDLVLESAAGGREIPLRVEIARTEAQRTQGLMGRKSLADGEGMVFVFDRDEVLSFWMKNTLIPLSIAFIASDGRILEIRDMEPLSLKAVTSSRSARYALEVPQGWFERAGVVPGDRMVL